MRAAIVTEGSRPSGSPREARITASPLRVAHRLAKQRRFYCPLTTCRSYFACEISEGVRSSLDDVSRGEALLFRIRRQSVCEMELEGEQD